PLLPPYLKVDFSDVPALIAGLVFSPLAGILVVFLKNALYFVATGATDPIGVAANFIAGTLYVFPVAYLYKRYKGVKSIVEIGRASCRERVGMSAVAASMYD